MVMLIMITIMPLVIRTATIMTTLMITSTGTIMTMSIIIMATSTIIIMLIRMITSTGTITTMGIITMATSTAIIMVIHTIMGTLILMIILTTIHMSMDRMPASLR